MITTDATTGGYEARTPRHSGPRFLWVAATSPVRCKRMSCLTVGAGWRFAQANARRISGFRVPPEPLQLQLGGKAFAVQRNFKISLS